MNFYEYQKKAMRTANMGLSDNEQLVNAALGLAGEAGELANEVKKWMYQGHDFDKAKIINEGGDLAWYLALLCQSMGVDMEDMVQYNLDKLMKRYPEAFSPNHSIERVDVEE